MVHWLELIYFLLLLVALLRCLYFWQLKEYRWDRFREFLKTGEAGRYLLPGRYFLSPRPTLKILILFYLSVYFSVMIIRYFPDQRLAPLIAYFLVPFSTGLAVILFWPLTEIMIALVVGLAWFKLNFFHRHLLVIGVTGSYGKTSTKEILSHILQSKYRLAKTRETNNTLIGVAKTILFNLPLKTEVFVVEMGAYRVGEIAAICRLVRPQIGILTGINQQHLGLFGSQEKIIAAKSELLLALPKNGLAVINGVNPITKKLTAAAPVKYYRPGHYSTNLLGAHQQLNLSAAVTVAKYLGIKQFNLKNIPDFKTAIKKMKGLNSAVIINDSYNSNPDGFLAAIKLAKSIPAGKKILVSPGIIELGRESEAVHRRLRIAAEKVFDEVWITKNEAQLLIRLKKTLTKNHLLLIEGRFSQKFIKALC